ncbi:MAG: histidine kinase [Chitinophagaceae bacterium]|nr:histidine kinase [Chitinophagaceae bacterium]
MAKKITGSHVLQITGIFIVGVLCYRAIAVYIVYPYVMKANVSEIIFISQPGFVTAFLDIVVPVSLLSSFEFYRISMDGKVRESRLEREKLQSELSFLKAQTNPHFLFNTLSNIYGLTKNLAPKAADAVDRLSALLRFMLLRIRTENNFYSGREEIYGRLY